MAISNFAIWEVESGGNDTNGGGFVFGATGTDYSQQTSAQISVADAIAVGSTTITSATANFDSTHVGNIAYMQGGTGSLTAGWYQVISVTNATTIVVDTNVATGTGITFHLGGAFATIQVALDQLIDSQIIYIKKAIYTITATLTFPAISASNQYTRIIGYDVVRGDLGQPTIQQTAAVDGIAVTPNGISLQNLIFDGTNTGLAGINISNGYNTVNNCLVKNWTDHCLLLNSSGLIIYKTEVTGCSATHAVQFNSNIIFDSCYVHDNGHNGLNALSAQFTTITNCIIVNNGGIGLLGPSNTSILKDCLFYGNGGDGLYFDNQFGLNLGTIVQNNIFALNGGYGIHAQNSNTQNNSYPAVQNNGFWSNTSGAILNVILDSTNVQISGTSPTNDPFVNDAAKNWALNNTAGAGALFRAAGFPGKFLGLSTSTGYRDIGPFQHQDTPNTNASSTFVMA